jgi:hypothetical protein
MVSDTSIEELKEFAGKLGIPDKGFQGDHFDVPEHMRQLAIDQGAKEVSSREILRALYAAGMRKRPSERHGRPKNVPIHQP